MLLNGLKHMPNSALSCCTRTLLKYAQIKANNIKTWFNGLVNRPTRKLIDQACSASPGGDKQLS